MKSGLFSVLKIAVVAMMLVWGVKQAQAESCPTCTGEPVDPVQYGTCMTQCVTAFQNCLDDTAGCETCCEPIFDDCCTECYNEYCI